MHNPPVNSMPYLGPELCSHKSPKRVQMSQNPLYKVQIQVYPHKVEPLQNSNPCQNKTLQNQGSNQKNTPQSSGPKFIQKLLP